MHIVNCDCASRQTNQRLTISGGKRVHAAAWDSTVLCWKMVERIRSSLMVSHRSSALRQRALQAAFYSSLLKATPISLSRSTSHGCSRPPLEKLGVFAPCLSAALPSSDRSKESKKESLGR